LLALRGQHREADLLSAEAMHSLESKLGGEHIASASVAVSRAEILCLTGRYPEAEELYGRALTVHEKVFGREHPKTADILSRLANIHEVQGRLSEAAGFYDAAASANPQKATHFVDLARILLQLGKADRANAAIQEGKNWHAADPNYWHDLAI